MASKEDRENDDPEVNSSDEEGIDVMNSDADSSEEDEDDPEEEARIREGFIADDDDDDARERRRRKKKKRKQKEREFEALSDDDLDLVEQNTGVRIERPEVRKLKKLKRAGATSDPDDIDEDEEEADVANLFDERREKKSKGRQIDDTNLMAKANRALDMDEDEDDMADFIEEDSPDEDGEGGAVRSQEKKLSRDILRKERSKQRRAAGIAMAGMDITAEAWDEIQEVFGDGHDYDDALESDDETSKPAPTIRDVFEPSEIAERMMTDADDIIRAIDIPERMQIAQAGISARAAPLGPDGLPAGEPSDYLLDPDQLNEAAVWVSSRISPKSTEAFLLDGPDGQPAPLKEAFMTAVFRVINFLAIEYFEVPFIWVHRRDYFVHYNPDAPDYADRSRALLTRDDLWRIYTLCIKFRALADKKAGLAKLWQKLQVEDGYFDEMFARIESLEEAADLTEWVTVKYASKLKELAHRAGAEMIADDAEADIVRNGAGGVKYKRATTDSRYERAKDSLVARFAEQIAIPAETVAADFVLGAKQHYLDDPHSAPDYFAQEFTDPNSYFSDSQSVISAAKIILVAEMGKEPTLRREIRKTFRGFGCVTVRPTETGQAKIDEMHPYYNFKYLLDKPINDFLRSAQFLQILAAENEGLVTIDMHIAKEPLHKLTQEFYTVYLSDLTSDDARAWNRIREEVVVETLQNHLLPLGARWMRDWLKDEETEWLAAKCASKLEERADMAPFKPADKSKGDVPRVMAISAGQGDPKRDFVYAVTLNARGRLISHERFEDLMREDTKEAFLDLLKRIKPDVIAIGGFSPSTNRLRADISICTDTIGKQRMDEIDSSNMDHEKAAAARAKALIPITYVHDDIARLYQHSKRAMADFGEITSVARYCIGLARYVQSPLCEYAALGDDLTAINYDPMQKLLPRDKLLPVLQNTLVNVVNLVGVDINKAIRDPYYRVLLPYVAGLGPRKASGMVKRINAICAGTLVCRADLVKRDICTSRIFMNCVAFLRIPPTEMEEEDEYDILDSTRIHSEDYHIARKMAADAEEMDEEDIEDLAHPSGAVSQLMENDPKKLDELSLDDFAAALLETQQLSKRITLYTIRDELQRPYSEQRTEFKAPTMQEIFTMLTGETRQTLDVGLVVPVVVITTPKDGSVIVRLDSGIRGIIHSGYVEPGVQYRSGMTVQAQVIGMDLTEMTVELSLLAQSIQSDDRERRMVKPDKYYDHTQASMDKQASEAKNKRKEGRQRRVVNHPNFQNFNAGQAEQYLANLQRGDCVIRSSSRGNDHLAVTWKVDDGVYQHIDVLELDKPNEFSLGRSLRIQGKYTYSDLDELIVSHVRAMARKVDEMMHAEKYRGTEAELRQWLSTSIMAEPARSFYGFALDPRKPGNFILSFLTKGYDIQTWNVTVEPDSFVLQGNSDPAPNVTMLCNAFKSTYMTRMALAGGHAGLPARTPYGAGRTPMQGGRTPLPGGGRTPLPGGRTPMNAGGMTPYQAARSPYGAGRTAGMPPPPQSGPYINPARAAQAGFGQSSHQSW